ncbi:MAG: VWA domain-containing protein [Verrucomicrobiota bacterium]
MQFLQPQFLWLLLLGLIPVTLYLFRRKSRSVTVSTLGFFKTLAQEHQESAWLRRLKKWLSFVITLLLLILATALLARMVPTQDSIGQLRSLVILLDRSATMAVAGEGGAPGLERARQVIVDRLEKLPQDMSISLLAYDSRPEVIQPATLNRRELISRLHRVEVRPIAANAERALDAARILAQIDTPSLIWHLSDRQLAEGVDLDGESSRMNSENLAISIEELTLAPDKVTNPGITAFQLRPIPLEHSRYEAFVQVALNEAAIEPVQARVEISIAGIPNQLRKIQLDPGERQGLTFAINGVSRQILKIDLIAEVDDFDLDNHVATELPDARPILAAWIREGESEDPFVRLALSAIQEEGRFEILKGDPDAWPLNQEVDVVVFDGWLPEEWPEDLPAVVINPPRQVGPIPAQLLAEPVPFASVRVENENHPVLFRVSSSRVAVTQSAVLRDEGGFEPLWYAGDETVLSAGEVKGQRIVVMGFSPGNSPRLPLTASFPLLIGNALFWCTERSLDQATASVFSAGELVGIDEGTLTWTYWDQGEQRSFRQKAREGVLEMDRIGLWKTDSGLRGSSFILSASESDIPAQGDAESDSESAFEARGLGNWKMILLAVIGLLLLLESCLFHRFAVY